ncbi:sigma-70 family RNA polymerase sigma factor [Robertmurraya sp. DFI.2.37]|uniref:sigma-70 family RNA polymerase sigma factor n=1 Tax=Robertmurraya sp. DFI.2.37 TaxID=3031819 RepID=UPI00124899F4|nr:sigma-70 family RNA polymerase sigma factor [Robertmurraya sp. DFI.2.37]MDF1508155.1 sigma-70 family RNA polymerase sigma factor [Robertmurraya sp. DFI.2.37]
MKDFAELEKQYGAMIWQVIHSLHIYKNQEEFYQTGLIALWQASERYDFKKGSFSSFAYSYIRGRILTELTKHHKHENHYVVPDEDYWNMLEDHSLCTPLEKESILAYCQNLTTNQKKWVLYTILADLSIKKIAEIENVSISAVKAWRKGARTKLLEEVRKEK